MVRTLVDATPIGARVDVDTAVGLTRDRRTDSVDDTNAQRAALHAVAERQDRVRRLAALAQLHTLIVMEDGRLAVQEVGRKLDAYGRIVSASKIERVAMHEW